MKRKFYKISGIIILRGVFILMLLIIAKNALAISLILDYPSIEGETLSEGSTVPDIIRYIYLFSIGIVGITALLSIIIGAFQYITSAGSPDKAGDAKDRIFSAVIGVIILLASVLILNTINPDLTKNIFTVPGAGGGGGGGGGTMQYKCLCCTYTPPNPPCVPSPTSIITHPQYWPQACMTFSSQAQANQNCKQACNICLTPTCVEVPKATSPCS